MTTKTNADCTSRGLCHYDGATRTKFFHGMLLTDEHLRLEQTYHRQGLDRVHRYLWGPGIVCGFEVEWVSGLCLKLHPGLAIDCHGRAIELCRCVTIDLSDVCKKQYPGGCTPGDAQPFTKYLVLRYATVEEDPQPVLTTGDECGGQSRCEKSRVREGFCLDFVDKCPPPCEEEKKDDPGVREDPNAALQTGAQRGVPDWMSPLRRCPSCECGCDSCEIGLAQLIVNCARFTIEVAKGCRTYALERRDRDRVLADLKRHDAGVNDLARRVAALEAQVRRLGGQGGKGGRRRGAPPAAAPLQSTP